MHPLDNIRLSEESRTSDQFGPATGIAQPAAEFDRAIGDVIELVNCAFVDSRDDAVVARINAHLPPLLAALRAHLPESLLRVDDHGYRRLELHQCPLSGFQILAMVWGPGQRTPIHDHDQRWGVEAVLLGELQVARYRVVEAAGTAVRLRAHSVVELPSGGIETIDVEHGLHLCRNPSQREIAVSLHIYAQPLDSYGVYDDQCDGWHMPRTHFPPLEALGT